MRRDVQTVAHGAVVEADVCIVGAGPAGIALALELDRAGLTVCLIESGGSRADAAAQGLARGENVDRVYPRLQRTRMRGFGGTSNHWHLSSGMRSRPLDERDFAARPEVGLPGWPIPRGELDPFYERAHTMCELGEVVRAPDGGDQGGPSPTGLDPAFVADVVFKLAARDVFTRRLPDIDLSQNVTLIVDSTVRELVLDEAGQRVERAEVRSGRSHQFSVQARAFALCCGGIENPRLLLASSCRRPAGLGNGHDLVGRYFMEHPHVRTAVLRPSGPGLSEHLRAYGLHPGPGGVPQITMWRLTDEVLRERALLSTAWRLTPVAEDHVSAPGRALIGLHEAWASRRILPATARRVRALGTHAPAVGAFVGRRLLGRARPPRLLRLDVMSEQQPDRESRVTLGRGRDRFGGPLAALDWRIGDLDRRSIRVGQELLAAALARAGLGVVEQMLGDEPLPSNLGAGYHHMGTTRMHADPGKGVVDADGRVHEVGNLFVAGTSVFPTGGYANPTLTVVALAIRLADQLRKEWG